MSPLAILLIALAFLYTIGQAGVVIALCSILERRRTFTVSLNQALIIDVLLLVGAYFANANNL